MSSTQRLYELLKPPVKRSVAHEDADMAAAIAADLLDVAEGRADGRTLADALAAIDTLRRSVAARTATK